MEDTEKTVIPFETTRVPNGDKPLGYEEVIEDGVDGNRTIVRVDGQIVSDKTTHPKNQVIYYGTKEEENVSTSESPQEELKNQPPQNVEVDKDSFVPPYTGYSNQSQGRFSELWGKIKGIGITNMNGNALFVRAFKTFVQAGLATWAVTGFDFTTGAIVGAIAAGISALMNLFIKPTEA